MSPPSGWIHASGCTSGRSSLDLTTPLWCSSTHLIDDVEAICDRVVVLHGGVAKFDGTTSEMEALSRDDLPGHSRLERAYMHLLPVQEQQL